jgi:ElaB/YqjD/DUF883 family membrane-anchored ribosome-binding protein
VITTIKENPIPAALAGIGLGWLVMRMRSKSSEQRFAGYHPSRDYGYGPTTNYPTGRNYASYGYETYGYQPGYTPSDQSGSGAGSTVDQAKNTVGQATGQIQDTASQMAGQVQDTAGQVANQVQDTASQIGYQAQYQAQRAAGGFQQMLDTNPLAVGAMAVAAGIAVGMIVPETPQEHQLMGEARDNLMDKAQQTAQDTVQKVQSVAQEAVGAAKQEVQNQGLA